MRRLRTGWGRSRGDRSTSEVGAPGLARTGCLPLLPCGGSRDSGLADLGRGGLMMLAHPVRWQADFGCRCRRVAPLGVSCEYTPTSRMRCPILGAQDVASTARRRGRVYCFSHRPTTATAGTEDASGTTILEPGAGGGNARGECADAAASVGGWDADGSPVWSADSGGCAGDRGEVWGRGLTGMAATAIDVLLRLMIQDSGS